MKKICILLSIITIVLKGQIGPNWSIQNSNFPDTVWGIRCMDAVDPNVVWAIGKEGYYPKHNCVDFTRTINGGITYLSGKIFPDTNTYHPISIEGIDANTAWVTSYLNSTQNKGSIYRTTNGGVTWSNMTPANMYTASTSFANLTCFITSSIGVTVGDPVSGKFEIHRTIDGGNTWSAIAGTVIPNPLTGETAAMDVYEKYNSRYIWFGTNKGRIIYSGDFGQTWNVGSVGSNYIIWRIAFRDANNGLALAYTYSSSVNFSLFKTNNGGSTWTNIPLDPNLGLNGLSAIPGTNWYASCGSEMGNQLLSYTKDDGTTWINWGCANIQFLDIDFVNNNVGYAGGFSNKTNPSIDGMYKYIGTPLSNENIENTSISLSLFPNPNSGSFTIQTKDDVILEIVNELGQLVKTVKLDANNNHQTNITGLSDGVYCLKDKLGGTIIKNKIVVVN